MLKVELKSNLLHVLNIYVFAEDQIFTQIRLCENIQHTIEDLFNIYR